MTEERGPGRMLEIAGLAAQIILENGAETYRVEDTVRRLCASYGYADSDVIALSTGVMLSVSSGGDSQSAIRRVRKRGLHLARVNAVNDLSRRAAEGSLTMDEAFEGLRAIDRSPSPSLASQTLWAGLCAASFTLMFGGGVREFVVAALAGALCQLSARVIRRAEYSLVLVSLTGGIICSLLAIAGYLVFNFRFVHVETILSGAIMPLISGLMMTNAVRDSLRGDLLSGMARGFEALLVAAMVALGISVSLHFYGVIAGGVQNASQPAWPVAALLAGVGTLCFCPLLSVPRRAWPMATLLGTLSYALYASLFEVAGLSETLALFIAAALISLLCEFLARRMQMIATIFLCAALIPLVPGLSLYRTMRELMVTGYQDALSMGSQTLFFVGAIALGAALGSLRILRPERMESK